MGAYTGPYAFEGAEWHMARAAQEAKHYSNDAPTRAELAAEREEEQ